MLEGEGRLRNHPFRSRKEERWFHLECGVRSRSHGAKTPS